MAAPAAFPAVPAVPSPCHDGRGPARLAAVPGALHHAVRQARQPVAPVLRRACALGLQVSRQAEVPRAETAEVRSGATTVRRAVETIGQRREASNRHATERATEQTAAQAGHRPARAGLASAIGPRADGEIRRRENV